MKKIALFLLVVFCLGLTGCNKDAEINAFIAENNAVIKDIVAKIDADPSEKGVNEAQKSFDAKKDGLKAKWDAIKNVRGAQVSTDTQKKLNDSMAADMKLLTDVQQKHSQKLAASGDAMNKFVKLVQAYAEIIKM
jgi:hypothetical protein